MQKRIFDREFMRGSDPLFFRPVDDMDVGIIGGDLIQILAGAVGGVVIDNKNMARRVQGPNPIHPGFDVVPLVIGGGENQYFLSGHI